MAPPGRPNMTSTCCISRLLISACAPVSSIGCSLVGDGRWVTVDGGAGPPVGHRRADMKTTSHLGGRKAHTAKKRRVRYERGTRVLEWVDLVDIAPTVCHGPDPVDKEGAVDRPDRTVGLPGDHVEVPAPVK
jgi:hypothetical protein